MALNDSIAPEEPLRERIREYFGFHKFRPGQAEAVDSALKGRDTLVVMPTGSGKSLCFQLSAIALQEGITVVVSPLISLMKDQVDNLFKNGVWAVGMNSTLTPSQQIAAEKDIVQGRAFIVYATPERLADPRFREFLKLFGFERVIELGHWEQHSLRNGLVVTAVPFIGEGTAEDGAVRNCYLLERGGNRILVHVDSSIDSTGRSDLTDGAIERLVNERGPIDVLYATRRQELHFGFEIQHDLSPMFLGADPRRFVGVTENCFCPASYIVNLAREARCSMVVLYSEGGAEWYPSDTNFLRTGDDESFLGHDYLWDSLNDIVDAAPAPVYLSQALDAVLVDDHRIKYVSGRNRF